MNYENNGYSFVPIPNTNPQAYIAKKIDNGFADVSNITETNDWTVYKPAMDPELLEIKRELAVEKLYSKHLRELVVILIEKEKAYSHLWSAKQYLLKLAMEGAEQDWETVTILNNAMHELDMERVNGKTIRYKYAGIDSSGRVKSENGAEHGAEHLEDRSL